MSAMVSTNSARPAAQQQAASAAAAPLRYDFVAEDPVDTAIHAGLARATGGFSPVGLAEAWFDWAAHLAVSPMRLAELAAHAASEAARLAPLWLGAAGEARCAPCEHSLPQDKRFRSEAWRRWPYATFAESFLAMERWWDEATSNVHGASRHHLSLLNFVGRQALDMVAPSNFLATNPDVLQTTLRTGGVNLLRGAAFAWEDLARLLQEERPAGTDAFKPGETVALTPGKVVLRTELAEVIQYDATTAQVRPEPVVIVPAWIMKYYILDLRPANSLIKHLVDQGFTVFVISWKNPGPEDGGIGFDSYRELGVLPALSAALRITGAARAHAVGYCIGGTLLAATAAAMARDLDDRLRTVTLLAAQTDFTEAGELRVFIDDSQIAALDDMMAEQGSLAASRMAGAFNLLRSNDLIWSRMIGAYLMGEREPLTDIAAWSSDSTRMPRRMHSEYLRAFYRDNDLADGRFLIDGRPVALQDIRVPLFVLGTEWDHVAPWRSVYKIHRLAGGDVTFALTNGGHNQGVISAPGRADRRFRIASTPAGARDQDPDSWFAAAERRQGSWWPAWWEWLAARSGAPVPAPARAGLDLGPAPGAYVFG